MVVQTARKTLPTSVSFVRLVWGLPNTLLGIAFVALSIACPRRRGNILLAETDRGLAHLFLSRRGFCAITLGRVVICTSQMDSATWVHELEHVAQSERWGPLFLPVYLFWHVRRGYHMNPLEVQAQEKAEAYTQSLSDLPGQAR